MPRWAWIVLAAAALLSMVVLSLGIGSYKEVTVKKSIEWLVGLKGVSPTEYAVLKLRLRRTIAGIVVGSALGFAGASLQYVLRNPLADPYIFGIASGAALGVIVALYVGASSPFLVYLAALLGALTALGAVVAGGMLGGGTSFSFIVAGVSVGYLLWAASTVLLILMGPQAHYSFLWLFGTLAYVEAEELKFSAVLVVTIAVVALILNKRYSKLMLGRDVAAVHGTPYSRALLELVVLSSIATAAATALTGPIGFVGLMAPWIARLTTSTLYAAFISSTLLWGATLVLFSDIIGRLVGGSAELPLTAVMAFIGVPFIVYVMVKARGATPWK